MPSTKKECLDKLCENFLRELDKLDHSSRVLRDRNSDGSFFLNNDDVSNIERRQKVMEFLFKPVVNKIHATSHAEQGVKKFISTNYNLEQKIAHLKQHINTLSEDECGDVLTHFLDKTNAWKNDKTQESTSDYPESMSTEQRSDVLSAHSFNDSWIFTFLAKLILQIEQVLGMKTTSEKLLDETEEEITSFTPK